MSLDNIKFNPYDDKFNIEEAVSAFEMSVNSSSLENSIEELATRVYFDNSYNWKLLIPAIYKKYNLEEITVNYFNQLISDQRVDVLAKYTYLITLLIANNILSLNNIDKINIKGLFEVDKKDSKLILLSFLATWNLDKALEIDHVYIETNFKHLIQAKAAPINDLIANSNNEMYYNILKGLLEDNKIQFHINQAIQKIIRDNNTKEIQGLKVFVDKCLKNSSDAELEFILDALELSSLKEFLLKTWNLKFTETLYNYFAHINATIEDSKKTRALSIINRFKNNIQPSFLIAARHQINKLHNNDKDFIIDKVKKIYNNKVESFSKPLITFEDANRSWEWSDYAHYLVNHFRKNYPDDESIDVKKLCIDLNLNLIIHEFETIDFDACLVRDITLVSPIIFVNSNRKSRGRVNFSIAHELAHAVIPAHSNQSFFCFMDDVSEDNRIKMDKKLEIEANEFASNILLPNVEFKEATSKLNFNIGNVVEISRRFDTSYVLVAKKWAELSTLEIAMIVSTNGIIDWAAKSDTFPYKWIESIPKDSTVYDVINDNIWNSKPKMTHSHKWVDSPFDKTILEESIRIFENTALTLLQIIED